MIHRWPNRTITWKSGISMLLLVSQLVGMAVPANAIPVRSHAEPGRALLSGISGSWKAALNRFMVTARRWRSAAGYVLPDRRSGSDEFSRLARTQFPEPLVATRTTSAEEDQALLHAIRAYRQQAVPDDFRSLEAFLAAYPHSGWNAALLTNLGLLSYHYGFFSRAITAWERAWEAGRTLTEPRVKALVDRAIGELVRMHARLGHTEQLDSLLKAIEPRPMTGPATEAVAGAKDGLWVMRHNPGVAYLCGPLALQNLLIVLHSPVETIERLREVRSGPNGFTLAQVAQLADQAKLSHRVVFREPGQPVPVPALVHWKLSHFATIVEEHNGRFRIKDPTFGTDLWVTLNAIDSEASGYLLIPAGTRGAWRTANTDEMSRVRGMGFAVAVEMDATTPQDEKAKPGDCGVGMCAYNFHEMTVSLNLTDTPVGYRPPRGPAAYVTLTYNQREARQPANFGFFNVGPKWTLNWLSYIEDDPTCAACSAVRYVAGGGAVHYPAEGVPYGGDDADGRRDGFKCERFAGSNCVYGKFPPEPRDGSVLWFYTDGNLVIYTRSSPTAVPKCTPKCTPSPTVNPNGRAASS
jgi:hypothetical protein